MKEAIENLDYIYEMDNYDFAAARHFVIHENQKLQEKIERLQSMINTLHAKLASAEQEAQRYREMYQALRKGHYLLIPK